MRIAIHQPNFFPWYPFFEKMKEVDIFVIMAHCQFEKNGYQNRFNLNDQWYTLRVKKGLEPIKDKVYINAIEDWGKIKTKLPEYKSILDQFDTEIENDLSSTNVDVILTLKDMLNIPTKIKRDYPTNLKSTERLVDICKFYGADTYLSGTGAKEYLDEEEFRKAGIKVEYQVIKDPRHTLEVL